MVAVFKLNLLFIIKIFCDYFLSMFTLIIRRDLSCYTFLSSLFFFIHWNLRCIVLTEYWVNCAVLFHFLTWLFMLYFWPMFWETVTNIISKVLKRNCICWQHAVKIDKNTTIHRAQVINMPVIKRYAANKPKNLSPFLLYVTLLREFCCFLMDTLTEWPVIYASVIYFEFLCLTHYIKII